MIHLLQPRTLDMISGASVAIALVSLGYSFIESGANELGLQAIQRLTDWGFVPEALLAVSGVVALIVLTVSGGGGTIVAAGAMGLILLINLMMAPSSNTHTHFPTSLGGERPTLAQMAARSPNVNISRNIPTAIRIGDALGDASLAMPSGTLAGRIRAFTDLEVMVTGAVHSSQTVVGELGNLRDLGLHGDTEIVMVGEGESYVWVELEGNAAAIVATKLVDDLER